MFHPLTGIHKNDFHMYRLAKENAKQLFILTIGSFWGDNFGSQVASFSDFLLPIWTFLWNRSGSLLVLSHFLTKDLIRNKKCWESAPINVQVTELRSSDTSELQDLQSLAKRLRLTHTAAGKVTKRPGGYWPPGWDNKSIQKSQKNDASGSYQPLL